MLKRTSGDSADTPPHERVSARQRYPRATPSPVARPSDFVYWLPDLLDTGASVRGVLYPRVSGLVQWWHGSLDRQELELQKLVEQLGFEVVASFRDISNGWATDRDDRGRLVAAAEYAVQHDAILIAATFPRFLRSKAYNNKSNIDALVTELECFRLVDLVGDAKLATYLRPDASPSEVRSFDTRRGKRLCGDRGGRPRDKYAGWTIDRRDELMPKIRQRLAEGKSDKSTAKHFGVDWRTFRRWLGRG